MAIGAIHRADGGLPQAKALSTLASS